MHLNRDFLILLGSLLVIGALYSHYLAHSVLLFQLILVAFGSLMVILAIRKGEIEKRDEEKGLLTVSLSRFLTEEQCSVLFLLSGFLLILIWSIWKIFMAGETNLRMEDFIVTLFGLSLVLYSSSYLKFQRTKDFIVIYLFLITILFVVIWKIFSLMAGESYIRITAYSEYHSVTQPVVGVLQLFGENVTAVLNFSGIGLSNIIEYYYEGRLMRLSIGISCSGFYSTGLFFSAFLSFVSVRYWKINRYIIIALILGLVLTWASNIFRLIVTVAIGIKYGHAALRTFHMYFGIILFILIIAIFWWYIVKWLDNIEKGKREMKTEKGEETVSSENQHPKIDENNIDFIEYEEMPESKKGV